jgi:hypothetical protein
MIIYGIINGMDINESCRYEYFFSASRLCLGAFDPA